MKKLFGGILMAVGLLIALGSGICSLAMLSDSYMSLGNVGEWLPLIAIFGGIPLVAGLGLFFLGRRMTRSAPPDA